MNFLVPTKRPRLNEAVGLVLFTLTVLVLLSLVSYHPTDPSFNVSHDPLSDSSVQNFIGRFGSTLADLLLQVLGYPAFLLPVIFSIFGWKWIRSRQMQNPWAKCVGIVCLVGSSCALLGLLFPNYLTVGWSLKAGGIVGDLLSDWFRARFNMTGSLIVVLAWLFVSLLVATRFSFSVSLVWLNRHFAFLGVWWEYWLAWCKSREKARERKLLEKKLQEEEKGNPRGATLITQTIMDLKERGPASARRIPKEPSPRDMDFAEPLAPIAPKKS